MLDFFQNAFDFIASLFAGIFNGFENLISVVKNVFSGFGTFLSLVTDILPFSNQVILMLPSVLIPPLLVCAGISMYKGIVHGS